MEFLQTGLTVQVAANAILGYITPYILEPLKRKVGFLGSKTLVVLSGVIGTGVAMLVNYVFVSQGLAEGLPFEALLLMGFGINQTAGEIGYRNHVKEKK